MLGAKGCTEDRDTDALPTINGEKIGYCEARVKKVLEALPQVEEAVVSHEAGTAVLTLAEEISNDELKKVIEDQDYEVLSVE